MKALLKQIAEAMRSGTEAHVIDTPNGKVAVSVTVTPVETGLLKIVVGIDQTNATIKILSPLDIEVIGYRLDDPDPESDDARLFEALEEDQGWKEVYNDNI